MNDMLQMSTSALILSRNKIVVDKNVTPLMVERKAKCYCVYRNSVNNAFLRLFRIVRTDRTMTIKIYCIYTPPNW